MIRNLCRVVGLPVASSQQYFVPPVDPKEDGEDCENDCESCVEKLPSRFHVDEKRELYGMVKPWGVHVLVATGKSDWVRKVERESGTLTEALAREDHGGKERLMILASNIEPPEEYYTDSKKPTTVLLLPAFIFVNHVTNSDVPELMRRFIDTSPSVTTPLSSKPALYPSGDLSYRDCPHDYVVLLCSHKHRDARCGISAPLIKRELERHLRPRGLYRDSNDERPGGVGIYYVSHVGGHKFAANVLVYRKKEGQMIWLARIRPEHCEGLVKWTILEGKVVDPDRRLRGGWDRGKGVGSW
ncbi:MAG: hypothetical protein M1834_007885 [Cirrosporium novae-zelandiae]|nr:MAG: hypothetical protein M1834_007885 [Cirrosporium novae-zelandiae]